MLGISLLKDEPTPHSRKEEDPERNLLAGKNHLFSTDPKGMKFMTSNPVDEQARCSESEISSKNMFRLCLIYLV
jgi:hypothetical protein